MSRASARMVEMMTEEIYSLRTGIAASPCGVGGHLRLHWKADIVCHPSHMSAAALESGAVAEDRGTCILCERQAKLLEAAEWLHWLAVARPNVFPSEQFMHYQGIVREARAAAVIAEEHK